MIRLTRAQVREVDRRAIEQYGIPGIVLMENAARNATDIALSVLEGKAGAAVTIVCGGGNNGGDGLAVARHLHIRGVGVTLVECWEQDPTGDAAINLDIARQIKLPTAHPHDAEALLTPRAAQLVIDALFGTGLRRPVAGDAAALVHAMNGCGVPILAIDVPSGLDCDTGKPLGGVAVRAHTTVTFVAEKTGFANPAAAEYTGRVVVADIGAPQEIVAAVLKDCAA